MRSLGRLGIFALIVTYLHLVFGGIVRITGSGMGCGDHWPKCNGSWVPPFDNPTVMIEWTHRLLALLVILSLGALAIAAWRKRSEARVGGSAGVLRSAVTSVVLVIAVALLGMVTVKAGNSTVATVAHWTLAMALLATIAVTVIRAGALGGDAAVRDGGSVRAVRSIGAGAALALVAVVMGGLVAKFPGAAVACPAFPLCGATPADIPAGAPHVQLTHRIVAYLLVFHVLGISVAVRRRAGEAAPVKRAMKLATTLVFLQLAIGAAMVLASLPAALRALHQLVGIGVWLVLFVAAYLARLAATRQAEMGSRIWDTGGSDATLPESARP
jgi:heme A synthase